MAKENKFFKRWYKQKQVTSDNHFFNDINPLLLDEYIQKAVKFIKVKQFHSGFPEVFSHTLGGDIEVTITQDPFQPDIFEVNYQFIVLPEGVTLFRETKMINYHELKQFADQYDENKNQIEKELSKREAALQDVPNLKKPSSLTVTITGLTLSLVLFTIYFFW